jgi:hypothetical protein
MMVYKVEESNAFGVPLITQVEVLRLAHAGSAVVPPLIAQTVIAEPFVARVVGATDIAAPKLPVVPVAAL